MFIGEYQHAVDPKGRVAIPAKFRRGLEGGIVVTRGLDACLFVYPKDKWIKQAEKILSLPPWQANSRAFHRLMIGGAMDVECDAQGRILLGDHLRSYASIKEKVVIVGLYDRIEIWDETQWHEYRGTMEKNSDGIAEGIGRIA
ncbi:MAG: division/cell wall cluster transcriptional repressor MraZ [Patescibacteria group bacterium]